MMRKLKIGKPIFLASVCMLAATYLYADPQISARLSATEVVVGGQVLLSYEISGVDNVGSFPAINLPGMQVEPAGQTKSFQWVNGVTSSLISFNFALTPTQAGTYNIPPISLSGNGKTVTSNALTLNVVADSNRPQTNTKAAASNNEGNQVVNVPTEGIKPVFMTASVDKSKVYVGQQILLKVQFLRKPSVAVAQQPRYNEPDMTGFLVEQMKQQEYSTIINGVSYQVTELRYCLFPTSDGDFAIGSARVDLVMQAEVDPFDPNSFFQNFFGRTRTVNLNTRAIPIHVRALPKTKPINFSGSVGHFKMSARVDNPTPQVGKPFNLIVTVEGVGNIKTLKEPSWPVMNSLKQYETLSSSKVNNEGKFISGSKEFKVMLVPQVSGAITIPSISYVYFDPDQNDFITETTNEIPLQVKAGTAGATEPGIREPGLETPTTQEGIRVIEKDIRFQKTGSVRALSKPLYLSLGFYIFNLLPIIFAAGAFFINYYSQRRSLYADYYRSKGALKTSLKTVRQAEKHIETLPSPDFYGKLYQAIAFFLANKLNISGADLVMSNLKATLQNYKVSDETIRKLQNIMETSDMARFATSAFSLEEKQLAVKESQEVLVDLDHHL